LITETTNTAGARARVRPAAVLLQFPTTNARIMDLIPAIWMKLKRNGSNLKMSSLKETRNNFVQTPELGLTANFAIYLFDFTLGTISAA